MKTLRKIINTDVLIIGGGFAGLYAAIRAKDFVEQVTLVDKCKVTRSGCSAFLAGISFVCWPDDNKEEWLKEILQSGEYMNDQEWVKLFLDESYDRAMEMDRWGQDYGIKVYVRDDQGNFIRRRIRGHRHTLTMMVHSRSGVDTLGKKAKEKHVDIVNRVMLTEIIVHNGRACGAVGFNYRTGEIFEFRAKAVVLAAGGAGFKNVYGMHKNLTGDLQASAFRNGVIFKGLENTGFNSTAKNYDVHGLGLYAGVGGRFLNALGEDFMWKYDPELGSMARTSDLAIAFAKEVMAGRGPVYLDISRAKPEDEALCRKLLPEAFKTWDRSGENPFRDKVEWIPAMYGTVGSGGGISINTRCETNVPGLYAAGDSAVNPVYGTGGAVGGIAMMFAIVSGYRAGEYAALHAQRASPTSEAPAELVERSIDNFTAPARRVEGITPDEVILDLQRVITRHDVIFVRSESRLQQALAEVLKIKEEERPRVVANDLHELMKANEAGSLVTIAELILRAALFRKESRGFHFLEDHPLTNNRDWLKWVMVGQESNSTKVWAEEVPTPFFRPSQDFAVPPGVRRE